MTLWCFNFPYSHPSILGSALAMTISNHGSTTAEENSRRVLKGDSIGALQKLQSQKTVTILLGWQIIEEAPFLGLVLFWFDFGLFFFFPPLS